MKLAFWIIGAPCSGKSYEAKILGQRLNVPVYHLDLIDDRTNIDLMTRDEGYYDILKDLKDTIIIDGLIPFTFNDDMRIVKRILNDYKIIYLYLEPNYDQYILQLSKRQKEYYIGHPRFPKMLSSQEYLEYNNNFKRKVDRCLVLENGTDEITEEDIRSLNYQHDGFTDIKFKQLQINAVGKSVLDLGCSACQFEKYLNADKYTGLDVNLAYLINNNAHKFDLNNLERWNEPADIVICSSVFHYIHDKEKFIAECARLTKEVFVFETPLHNAPGKQLHLGSRNLYFPTRELLEEWIGKYFKSFEMIGESIVEDGSYRLIYHCYK